MMSASQRTISGVVVAMMLLLLPAGGASRLRGSIAYTSPRGDLWRIYLRTGTRQLLARHTSDSFYRLATQDDQGDVVSSVWPTRKWVLVRQHRHPREHFFDGVATGARSVADLQSCQSAVAGPLDPRLSPDGRILGSWAVVQDVQPAYPIGQTPVNAAPCTNTTLGGAILQPPGSVRGFKLNTQLGELAWPSFYRGDGVLLADEAGAGPLRSGLYYVAPGQSEPRQWLSGNNTPPTQYPVINRQTTRLAFSVALAGEDVLDVARLSGPPPAPPSRACTRPIQVPGGSITALDWSPDGRYVAWTGARGLWIGAISVPSSGIGNCRLFHVSLVARGGTGSSWSAFG